MITGQMAERLWRVTQAYFASDSQTICFLIGLSCVGSNPTLLNNVLPFQRITVPPDISNFA